MLGIQKELHHTTMYKLLVSIIFVFIVWFHFSAENDLLTAKPSKTLTEQEVLDALATSQSQKYLETNDYEHLVSTDLDERYQDMLPYETELIRYEYAGDKGYQVIFIDYIPTINATTSETEYTRITKSYGYGVEAELRTWDWR